MKLRLLFPHDTWLIACIFCCQQVCIRTLGDLNHLVVMGSDLIFLNVMVFNHCEGRILDRCDWYVRIHWFLRF